MAFSTFLLVHKATNSAMNTFFLLQLLEVIDQFIFHLVKKLLLIGDKIPSNMVVQTILKDFSTFRYKNLRSKLAYV